MRTANSLRWFLTASAILVASAAHSDGAGNPRPSTSIDSEYFDRQGNPTYKIEKNGAVDWYTYIGYTMYGANCLQCHGPDALGSSYAPSLVDALKSLNTSDVKSVIIGGKKNINSSQELVIPAFGVNKNVMCYIDAIYIYLRARSDGAVGRGWPDKFTPRPADYEKKLNSCLAG